MAMEIQSRRHTSQISLPIALTFCLVAAFILRAHMFGDPYYRRDESFYLLVGQLLHRGTELYSDIWDRKPPGLFAIYYLAAAFPNAVLAYQLFAWLAAGLTSLTIMRIAARFAGPAAQVVVALWYLASLNLLDGGGGQSPVFYNLAIALAALIVVTTDDYRSQWPYPRLMLAMALSGLAITIKQVAALEAGALGIALVWRRFQIDGTISGTVRWIWPLGLAGALPMLIILAWIAATNRLEIFIWAMAGSNTARWGQLVDPEAPIRLAKSLAIMAPPLFLTAWSYFLGSQDKRFQDIAFTLGIWLTATIGGALAVPTHYFHYLLPTLVPCAVGMALAVDRKRSAAVLAASLAIVGCLAEPIWTRQKAELHITQLGALAALVKAHDPHPKLLVLEGPIPLYDWLEARPLGPLVFPPHLISASERNVSHLDTEAELRRLVALRPTTITRFSESKAGTNPNANRLFDRYIAEHCNRAGSVVVEEEGVRARDVVVWSPCR